MSQQIHVGDVGTEFRILVKDEGVAMDLSGVSSMTVKFRTQTNTVKTKTPVFVNSGIDGLIKYVSEAGFLSEKGQWDLQVYIELPGGSRWSTDIVNFHVHPNI
jgi:hypothetical protein